MGRPFTVPTVMGESVQLIDGGTFFESYSTNEKMTNDKTRFLLPRDDGRRRLFCEGGHLLLLLLLSA